MDCPVWLRNTLISAPSERIGPNKSIADLFKPIHYENNERWLNSLGITATGKSLRKGEPPTRKNNNRGRLILSEPSPPNKSRPPRGAAGHRGSHSSMQRAPTGQAMTGKGTAVSVNTTETAPLGNAFQDTVTKAGVKRWWRSEKAVVKRKNHRALSVERSSRLLRQQFTALPGSQVATLALGGKRIGDRIPDPSSI